MILICSDHLEVFEIRLQQG